MIANSLFHFTKEMKTIVEIIRGKKFLASYNIEDIKDFHPEKRFVAIPMICFCDIPLKLIDDHTNSFGKFGIGLNKDWGIKNLINPLLYRIDQEGSMLEKALKVLFSENSEMIKQLEAINTIELDQFQKSTLFLADNSIDQAIRISAFTKPYSNGNRKYYNEREWRFVPENAQFIFPEDNGQAVREILNQDYSRASLSFDLNEIEHVIVSETAEIDSFIALIKDTPLTEDEKYKLIQKVNSLDKIKKDF